MPFVPDKTVGRFVPDQEDQTSPSLLSQIGSAVDQYKNSPQFSTSPVGMLDKLNQLASKGSNKVGQMATEEMGKRGVNPYLSAGVGTALSMTPDIIQAATTPNMSQQDAQQLTNNPASRFIGQQTARGLKMLSGNEPEDIAALYKSPEKFFAPSMDKAKSLYGAAVAAEGPTIPADEKNAFEAATKTAKTIIGKLKAAPDTVDPLEALEGRKALDEVIGSTKSGRKLAKLYELRKPLDQIVKSSPDLAKADEVYAASKLASKFRNFLPVTKNGNPAFFKSTIASMLSGALHNPLPSIATSPMAVGGITAAAGGFNNALTGILRGTPRYAPLLQALLGANSNGR